MFTFIYKQFFALFFLFIKIKIAIVSKKILAISIIKVRNFVVLTTLSNLKSKKDNFNIKSRNRNNKKKILQKNLSFSSFLFCFIFYKSCYLQILISTLILKLTIQILSICYFESTSLLYFLQKKTKLFKLLFDKSSLTSRLEFLSNQTFKNNFLF